ncbi:MAG: glycine cleavage system protein H [Actinomycetia bacterium]|nr:glycine cleavage system protein H [Actinomycetes bacterium]
MTDRVWAGCRVPDDRLYDLDLHVWVRMEGAEAVLGMTDVAQTMGGRIVALTWKRLGRQLRRGQAVAVVESAKWVGPFPTPLTGTLVAVNRPAFEADVAIANRDPYGAGWMARVRPSELATESGHLGDGAAAAEFYRAFVEENDIHCYRCAE